MKVKQVLLILMVLSLSLFFLGQKDAMAKPNSPKPKITEVYVNCDAEPPQIEIIGKSLISMRRPLKVTLGDFGELIILGTPTSNSILVEAPPDLCASPGDYLLTVGGRKKVEYNLTVGAVGLQGPQGPPGESGNVNLSVTTRTASVTVRAESCCEIASVSCNADEIVTGGGFSRDDDPALEVMTSGPDDNGWRAKMTNYGSGDRTLTVYAVCLKVQ